MPHITVSEGSDPEILHVFDLPQVHSKPAADDLIAALDLLRLQAPSWDRDSSEEAEQATSTVKKPQVSSEGVTNYLTSIIASPLRWLTDDGQKETIWKEASARLAERSGRTAMPAMSRSFNIPTGRNTIGLTIYEPSLTGDNLGFKTWAASFLLSKRLHSIALPSPEGGALRALELGSGTGLVGMALAAVRGASVLLTDLPEIEANLARNVQQNSGVITSGGGNAETAILDWTNPTTIIPSSRDKSTADSDMLATSAIPKFPIVVAADSIYSTEHPAMLVEAFKAWLSTGESARIIMEMPRRNGYSAELEDLKSRMLSMGLHILDEGEEKGYDDWGGSSEDERQEVNCWWSIWTWAT